MDKRRITDVVFRAIDEANKQLSSHEQLEKDMNTVLLGVSSGLDSLGSVIFFTAVEDKLEEELALKINLMDSDQSSGIGVSITTVETLVDYIVLLLSKSREGAVSEKKSDN
jgi:acyl carrier protein